MEFSEVRSDEQTGSKSNWSNTGNNHPPAIMKTDSVIMKKPLKESSEPNLGINLGTNTLFNNFFSDKNHVLFGDEENLN